MRVVPIPQGDHRYVSLVLKVVCPLLVLPFAMRVPLDRIHYQPKDLVWTVKLPITAWEEYGSHVQWGLYHQ